MLDLMEYRLADKSGRRMSRAELAAFLAQPRIMRIALCDYHDSHPIVHPVWYHYEKGKFLVATDSAGKKARALRKNPALYFLVDSDFGDGPPRGVRGRARARVVDDPDYATNVTRVNVIHYLGSAHSKSARKIIARGKMSSVIEITPLYMATWKF